MDGQTGRRTDGQGRNRRDDEHEMGANGSCDSLPHMAEKGQKGSSLVKNRESRKIEMKRYIQ